MNKRHIHFGLTAVIVLLSSTANLAFSQSPDAVVEMAAVSESNSSAVLHLPGTVISRQDAEIAAELSGRLSWVASVGDEVDQGDPVAVIDDHLLQLQLRNNLAEIRRIDADINYTGRQIARLERLAQQNNTAKSELDQIKSRLEMLNQDLQIAEISRDHTLYDLQRTQVAAPFSGIIVNRTMSTGEYTTPGTALVRLVDTESLEISVNAPLRVARFNQTGNLVQVDAGQDHLLTPIRGVIPVGDSRSRMMEVRIQLQPGHWYIGEAVTVELADGEKKHSLSIPRDALVLRNNEVFVYTVSSDNTAVKVPVITGAGLGKQIAIEGQIGVGDAVVVRGAESLREGQAVKILQHHLAAN
ncbi:MAG: efflux RND transporter periplasmic adaptor subunit [Halieaceae bacterium]|jgi:RND family efflux transporter MFP subunit|nr:efflux RND transporter periplasmic adaptor subunit [Halieaceae bacterium]